MLLLSCMLKKEKYIYLAYVSKQNSKREKQLIRLMISNEEGWHYLAVKKLYVLSREILLKPKTW